MLARAQAAQDRLTAQRFALKEIWRKNYADAATLRALDRFMRDQQLPGELSPEREDKHPVLTAWAAAAEALRTDAKAPLPADQPGTGSGSVLIGTIYALLDGAIGGGIVGWLYNRLAEGL